MNNKYIIARKVQLIIQGDKTEQNRVFKYLRDAIYNQNKAYNILISNVFAAIYSGKTVEEINDLYKKGQRKPKKNNPEYSLYKFDEVIFPTGMMTQSSVSMMVKNDIKTAKKNGLFKGKTSLPNRKLDAPLRIESQQFSFFHEYDTNDEFLEHLFIDDPKIYMDFVNGICFKVVFGNPHKSHEMRCIFQNIFNNNYKVLGSSIEISNNKIILNLSLEIQKKEVSLDENIVVGVDRGIAVPAVCALNNNDYIKLFIGSRDDFLRIRTQIKAERRRLNKSLKYTSGGHGRNKKLKSLDRFTEYEHNWVKTYNHKVSKAIVDFAVRNHAKYINIENLEGFNANNFFLENWNYYQLEQFITYKANKYGIVVRKINPYNTSQRCSCCGYENPENRPKKEKGQAYFKCLHCGKEMNADFNAARNISMSTEWSEGKVLKSDNRKQHEANN